MRPPRSVLRACSALSLLTLAVTLPAAEAPDPAAGASFYRRYLEKRKLVAPKDVTALLALGKWCEEERRPEYAVGCYKEICRLGEGAPGLQAHVVEALLRTARVHVQERNFAAAWPLLFELVGKHRSEEARAFLQTLAGAEARQQLNNLERGDEHFQAKRFPMALEEYKKALGYQEKSGQRSHLAPEEVILARLINCRSALDAEYLRLNTRPEAREVKDCTQCTHTGFHVCSNCKGSGKTRGIVLYNPGPNSLTSCDSCKGRGCSLCSACLGFGQVVKDRTRIETQMLERVRDTARKPEWMNTALSEPLTAMESVLLDAKYRSQLSILRMIKRRYALAEATQLHRAAAGAAPGAAKAQQKLLGEARTDGQDPRIVVNLLLGYACDVADRLLPFDILRGVKAADRVALTADWSTSPSVLIPERLAAFPEEALEGWILVRGVLTECVTISEDFKSYITVEGSSSSPHGIRFFAWLPSARVHMAWVSRGPEFRPRAQLSEQYPFDLAKRLKGAPKDHSVLLVGRFLRDRFAKTPNWFEVWDFRLDLSREQDKIYKVLAEPVDIAETRDVPVSEIARVLRDWFDIGIRFDPGVSGETKVNCVAERCPLGMLIDALACQAIHTQWYYGKEIVFSHSVSSERVRDMQVVLERLKKLQRGTLSIEIARTAAAPELPEDPAGLKVAARKAALSMRFEEAARCFELLARHPSYAVRAGLVQRLQKKFSLFDSVTRGTLVSRLADAPEISLIDYERPSSGSSGQIPVLVLERGKDEWLVQDAYGISFKIRAFSIRRCPTLGAGEWRERNRAEIERGMSEAPAAESTTERASRLFHLAIFAKRNGFPDRGWSLLEKAAREPGFEWVLESCFRQDAVELVDEWKQATGGVAPAGETLPARKQPPLAGTESGEEPGGAPPDGVVDLLKHAQEQSRLGSQFLGRSLEGQDAGKLRRQAVESFQEAMASLDKVLERDPENKEARNLRREVGSLLQIASKDLGFYD